MSTMTGTWKLDADVPGNFKKEIYGKAGDWVEVVADHDNVVIVQGADGNKFPVRKTNLSQGALQTPVEVTLQMMSEQKQGSAKKKKTAAPKVPVNTKQGSIFK